MRKKSTTGKRAAYHHGNLRDHLIAATRVLIATNGLEGFKVADACRHAGVSTAAPYRHFDDRQALLDAVAVAGFHDLRDQAKAAGEQHAKGSVSAVSAIGKAYVAFACHEPNLFRLMFGKSEMAESTTKHDRPHKELLDNAATPEYQTQSACKLAGRECYEVLLEQLAATLKQDTVNESVVKAAFPLWTFVHGLSFLLIDDNLSVNQMPIDINLQIEQATISLMPGPDYS